MLTGPLRLVTICMAMMLVATSCFLFEEEPEVPPIRIAMTAVGTLDPARATSPAALSLLRAACDGLTALDPDDGTPKPAIAEGWELSEDATELTLSIRSGITFSDGTAFTAQAAAETLSHIVRPSTGSPWAHLLQRIEGFEAVRADEAQSLSGVRTLDNHTLRIVLSEPFADLPSVLAHPSLTPLSPEATDAPFPICSGPYEFSAPSEGEGKIILSRDEDYGRTNEAFGEGDLTPTFEITTFEVNDEAMGAFRAGDVDASPVPLNIAASVASEDTYVQRPTNDIAYLAFHPGAGPSMRPEILQAVSTAMNRVIIVDAGFGDGRAPATRWLSDDFGRSPCEDINSDAGEPLKAKSRLEQAGIDPTKITIPLFFDPAVTDDLIAEALSLDIRGSLAITLEPGSRSGDEMATSAADLDQPGAWMFVHTPDLPIPERTLGALFDPSSGQNPSPQAAPAFEDHMAQAVARSSGPQRIDGYLAAEEAACGSLGKIPLWRGMRHWMYATSELSFRGDNPIDIFGGLVLRRLSRKI